MNQQTLLMPSKNEMPKDKAVKIDRDLAAKAKYLADLEGVYVSDWLSGILRPIIERRWAQATKEDQGKEDRK